MPKVQVVSRMSPETRQRLRDLAQKYGVSASALIVTLINDRWLLEQQQESLSAQPQPSAATPKRGKKRKKRR